MTLRCSKTRIWSERYTVIKDSDKIHTVAVSCQLEIKQCMSGLTLFYFLKLSLFYLHIY